jgi:hypothetical protein
MDLQNARALRNGESWERGMVFLLVYGGDLPEFFVTALPDRNIGKRRAIITESSGCVVKTANNMPVGDYFKSIGLALRQGLNSLSIPMMLDYGDGSAPVALTMVLNEDGSAVCAGETPEGASFSIGEIDSEGVLETAAVTVEKALKSGRTGGFLVFSCMSRYMMLSPKSDEEIHRLIEINGGKVPFWFCYAGGEVCPIRGDSGTLRNRLHNYTFTICAL